MSVDPYVGVLIGLAAWVAIGVLGGWFAGVFSPPRKTRTTFRLNKLGRPEAGVDRRPTLTHAGEVSAVHEAYTVKRWRNSARAFSPTPKTSSRYASIEPCLASIESSAPRR